MPNVLGPYNPVFYAQEALIQLEKALGMAARVYRGYDAERSSFNRGDSISIKKPSTFSAQSAPSSAQDLDVGTITLTLNQWKEVKFALTDKELAYTGDRIITDHIRPAAYALADDIDVALCSLYKDVPWVYALAGTTAATDITGPRKILFDNRVPMNDGNLHYMVGGALEADFLNLAIFHNANTAGPTNNEGALLRGSLGTRFGVEVFANQNVQTHTPGTLNDTSVLTNGTFAKGATSIDLDEVTLTGSTAIGDSFSIAGQTQRYAITNVVAASGNALTGVTFTPPLVAAVGDGTAVTIDQEGTAIVQHTQFHTNAFAIAMAPLPQIPGELGARVAVVSDPISGLSLRSRMYYDGDNSKVVVALDVLYGVKTLDPNLAVRGRRAT